MSAPKQLYETIDLMRHAIVNASAGTGKTYTIQNLYVRLITERKLEPAQILVLTFTEKATAELRQKIREQLLKTQATSSGENLERIHAALLSFENAQIFTIHGFCQRALSQFAYENGEPFRLNTGDDTGIYETALRDLLRNVWPQQFGDALPGLLSYAGFPDDGAWEDRVIQLAKKLRKRPSPADRILPEPPTTSAVLDAQKRAKLIFARIAALSAAQSGDEAPAVQQFARLRKQDALNKTFVKSGEGLLLSTLRHAALPSVDLLNAAQIFSHGKRSAKNFAKVKNSYEPALLACRELNETAGLLRELERASNNLKHAFTSLAAWNLNETVEQLKREEGLLSFEDMLTRLRDALDESVNARTAPLLLRGLRARYSAAIVDEAQDTDRVQWDILQRIFVGTDEIQQRLYAVGDPKQAIYGFRGADVQAYLLACDTLRDSAREYTLKENWRSTAPLTHAMNSLFGTEYFPTETRFSYTTVQAVDDSKRKVCVVSDPTHRGCPLVLFALKRNEFDDVEPENYVHLDVVRERVAEFTADEIERLVGVGRKRMMLKVGDVVRPLQPGDICVLIRAKSEALAIEQALSEKGIPHSHYKKDGLYESDEALELSCLFAAIAKPADNAALKRALLTSFFRMNPAELAAAAELPSEHRVRLLFTRWRQHAERRQWAQLFRSILDDTTVLTPPLKHAEHNAERRYMNFHHLMEELEITARRQHLDFIGIADHLHRCRFESMALEKDAGLQRMESERSKVQIMTMHVSKGLEFPVVFIAGGMRADPKESEYTYHQDGAVVHDIQKTDAGKDLSRKESEDETRRLYYVALTRAQVKLYVPYLRDDDKKKSNVAQVRVLGPRLDAVLTQRVPGVAILSWKGAESSRAIAEKSAPVSSDQVWVLQDFALIEKVLDGQMPSDYGLRRRVHRSYSALKHAQRAFGDQRGLRAGDEPALVRRRLEPLAFPAGTEAGSLLHALLEKIDFSAVMACESAEELAENATFIELLNREDVENIARTNAKYVGAAAGIVWRALHSRLDDTFALGQLLPSDRIQELEFTFPLPAGLRDAVPADLVKHLGLRLDRGSADVSGYLNGFIDLVYRQTVNGCVKYVVLDWKSDVLDAYDADSMRAHMDAMDYTLQYKVYALALTRWLKQCGLDPKKSFGGLQYIFLRGVGTNADEPLTGVLNIEVPDDLHTWELELYARLNDRRREREVGA